MASEPIAKDLSYDDIIVLKRGTEIILIDVREPSEIKETGILPGSVHIPRKFLHIYMKYVPDTEKDNSNVTFLCDGQSNFLAVHEISRPKLVIPLKKSHFVCNYVVK
jgi:hypothetical protein